MIFNFYTPVRFKCMDLSEVQIVVLNAIWSAATYVKMTMTESLGFSMVLHTQEYGAMSSKQINNPRWLPLWTRPSISKLAWQAIRTVLATNTTVNTWNRVIRSCGLSVSASFRGCPCSTIWSSYKYISTKFSSVVPIDAATLVITHIWFKLSVKLFTIHRCKQVQENKKIF